MGTNPAKWIAAGGILFLGGIALYLGVHIPAAKVAAELGGWSTPPGRLGTAMQETGGRTPTVFAIMFIVIGILLLLWGVLSEEVKRAARYLWVKTEQYRAERLADNERQEEL